VRTWQLQTARNRFSELFDAALGDGPQRVTRHGRQAVIIVSEADWSRRDAEMPPGPSLGEMLAECPVEPEDLRPRRPARVLRQA
jgi:prevent-host-death family protein